MPRFFLPTEYFTEKCPGIGDMIELNGDDAYHAANVLRLKNGENAVICSTDGTEYKCEFSHSEKNRKEVSSYFKVKEIKKSENEPRYTATVFQGMPKGKKTDSIVQKCVELGASKIVFVYTDRSVPEYENEKEESKKILRLKKIAEEASKQSGRGKLTEIEFLTSLDRAIPEMKKSDVCFFLYESEKDKSIKEVLKGDYESISFFVGPEGGVSDRESELLKSNSILPYSLGKLIMRTETCPVSVLSMILYEKQM